jgi:hypothetical protein
MKTTKYILDRYNQIEILDYIESLESKISSLESDLMAERTKLINLEYDLEQLQFELSRAPRNGGAIVGPVYISGN